MTRRRVQPASWRTVLSAGFSLSTAAADCILEGCNDPIPPPADALSICGWDGNLSNLEDIAAPNETAGCAYCKGGSCVAKKPAGAFCALDVECRSNDCRSGACFGCVADGCSSVSPTPRDGSSCSWGAVADWDASSGAMKPAGCAFCDMGRCKDKLPPDSPCTADEQCQGDSCVAGKCTACAFQNCATAAAPPVDFGMCRWGEGLGAAHRPTGCSFCSAGACVEKRSGGEACSGGNECQSNLCTDGVCDSCMFEGCDEAVPPPDDFGICRWSALGGPSPFRSPGCSFCSSGRCMQKYRASVECTADSECQSNFCDNGRCSDCRLEGCDLATAPPSATETCRWNIGTGAYKPRGCAFCRNGQCINKLSSGSACSSNEMCQGNKCEDGKCSSCHLEGCDQVGPAPADSSICRWTTDLEGRHKPQGCAFCAAGVCRNKKETGSVCSTDNECQSHSCVDGACHACAAQGCSEEAPPPGDTSVCFWDGADGSFTGDALAANRPKGCSFCSQGICKAKRAAQAECGSDNECQGNRCIHGKCSSCAAQGCGLALPPPGPNTDELCGWSRTEFLVEDFELKLNPHRPPGCSFCAGMQCMAKLPAGAPCTGHNECRSNQCTDGGCATTVNALNDTIVIIFALSFASLWIFFCGCMGCFFKMNSLLGAIAKGQQAVNQVKQAKPSTKGKKGGPSSSEPLGGGSSHVLFAEPED